MALTLINLAQHGIQKAGRSLAAAACGAGVALLSAGSAMADHSADHYGQARDWQLWLQKTVTPVGDFITSFHNGLLVTITVITLFVLALLVLVVVKFNAKANPVPSQTTHHVGLEVAWTLIPVLILVVIAVPSFRLLKMDVVPPPADMTLKVTGHAWYWRYEYPKAAGGFEFESRMMTEADIKDAIAKGKGKKEDFPRLLAVDNELVVPVNKVVVLQVTAADVIHAFAMPSFGMKIDAMPGRLNQTWFKATREGVYYGQCSELCGKDHAFMPIAIRVVSEAKYAAWLAEAKKKFASTEDAPARLASTESAR